MNSNPHSINYPLADSAAASVRMNSYRTESSSNSRPPSKRRLESYRLRGEYDRPWAAEGRKRNARYGNYIVWAFVVLGLLISALINFFTWRRVPQHQVSCLPRCSSGILIAVAKNLSEVLPGSR